MSELTTKEIEVKARKGEDVREYIETDLFNKILSVYEELEPNEKIVFLEMVSSSVRSFLIKVSFSHSVASAEAVSSATKNAS